MNADISIKRKFDEENQVETQYNKNIVNSDTNILELPHDVLAYINLFLDRQSLLNFEETNCAIRGLTQNAWCQLKVRDKLNISWEILENDPLRQKNEYIINRNLFQFVSPTPVSAIKKTGNSFTLRADTILKYGDMLNKFDFLKIYFYPQVILSGFDETNRVIEIKIYDQQWTVDTLLGILKNKFPPKITFKESGENLLLGLVALPFLLSTERIESFVKSLVFKEIKGNESSMNFLNLSLTKANRSTL